MVTLIVLSSMGVNIGPLMAGAGVGGLAIGFGAQKLVSDVLSGIFYLVDDAFRMGEYIEAGGVSGIVEGITLRNVMLRHHRGMLQIIPFSDLGSITNFMRGGIIVKFNLQFPYDTDIDKVRKTIKGVREMGDSVMTIRVKFTAKPGAHFVIRREAFKRITKALEAQGIQNAHRKVIVEVAQTNASTTDSPSQQPESRTGSDSAELSKVTITDYDSNATALAKVKASGQGFDMVVPSANYVKIFIELEGLALEVRPDQMENFKYVAPEWRNPAWDPGRRYSVPWQWGTVGMLDPESPVIQYVPEVADSAYGDCTVRHVLDMTVSSSFSEE